MHTHEHDDYAEMYDEELGYFHASNDDGAPGKVFVSYYREGKWDAFGNFFVGDVEDFMKDLQVVVNRVKRDMRNV